MHVAIVGAGPAGIFAAEALLAQSAMPVRVDLLDRLPAPYGLVRYGVAPDHPTIKSVASTLHEILSARGLRFVGGVEVGRSVSRQELGASYDAVVYATGAAADRRLGIPGEDLPGSMSATELVSWYNGHPDAPSIALDASSVAVIGAGNVALDIGRLLTSPYSRLAVTDMPSQVLSALAAAPVQNVHIIARRGPEHTKFSTKELRELDRIDDISRHVDPRCLDAAAIEAADRRTAANLKLFRDWTERSPKGPRQVHFRFWERPVEIVGTNRVEGIRLERTSLDAHGTAHGLGEHYTLPVQMVVRAAGYRSVAIPALPFDDAAGLVPNEAGRVTDAHGQPLGGEYVAGWLKRGPSGVIGTNKVDARETVASLVEDWENGTIAEIADRPALDVVLGARGVTPTGLTGWQNIDQEEIRRGHLEGRARSKIADWPTLSRLAGVPGNSYHRTGSTA